MATSLPMGRTGSPTRHPCPPMGLVTPLACSRPLLPGILYLPLAPPSLHHLLGGSPHLFLLTGPDCPIFPIQTRCCPHPPHSPPFPLHSHTHSRLPRQLKQLCPISIRCNLCRIGRGLCLPHHHHDNTQGCEYHYLCITMTTLLLVGITVI